MKIKILVLALIGINFGINSQNDVKIGTSYQLNLQRKNIHADAFILHNAEYFQANDVLKWNTTHNNFGSRGIRFSYSTNSGIHFYADNVPTISGTEFTPTTRLFIGNHGRIGVGTTNPDMELTVKGNIHAEEVKIDLNVPAPDYVFKEDYQLRTLGQLEDFIAENNHLPEMPSAKEFEQNGVMQAEMDMNLLKKIEELTLYTIQQEKKINEQNSKLKKQEHEIIELKSLNKELFDLQKRLEKLEQK